MFNTHATLGFLFTQTVWRSTLHSGALPRSVQRQQYHGHRTTGFNFELDLEQLEDLRIPWVQPEPIPPLTKPADQVFVLDRSQTTSTVANPAEQCNQRARRAA